MNILKKIELILLMMNKVYKMKLIKIEWNSELGILIKLTDNIAMERKDRPSFVRRSDRWI